jgi:hypothetical protein
MDDDTNDGGTMKLCRGSKIDIADFVGTRIIYMTECSKADMSGTGSVRSFACGRTLTFAYPCLAAVLVLHVHQ